MYEIELRLNPWKVLLRRSQYHLLETLLDCQFREAWTRHPIVPLLPKRHVTGVGKGRLALFIQASANVIRMAVGKNNRADLVRLNPFGSKKRKQPSWGRPHSIHS